MANPRREARLSARAAATLRPIAAALALASTVAAHAADGDAAASADYAAALELVAEARYGEALNALRRLQADFPTFEHLPAVQTRVAVLQEVPGGDAALGPFLDALAHRDAGRIEAAVTALEALVERHPDSTLVDDALYLSAYFTLMDRYAFEEARRLLLELGRRFPDTAYRDSAVYLDAIALEQLGDTDAARTALSVLRERHTALTLPFEFRWPTDNVLSRYWFDRAERRLSIIEQRLDEASTVGRRDEAGEGRLKLDVNVGGIDMTLLLSPSPLVRETAWLDAGLADRAPPAIGVYEGTVQGSEESWVRAVVREEAITGLIELDGVRHRLLPANLVGTLDYYRPKRHRGAGDGSTLAEMLEGDDALVPPPEIGGAEPGLGAARGPRSDVRAVPLSVVVDSQYDRYHAGDGLAAALNDLNVADGIYRELGFSLALDEVLTFDETRDPMALGPVSLETLLRSFRDYRLQRRTLFAGSALTYLFSGNPKTDVTLGLAWIDTLCRTDGYDVGVLTPSTFGDVLLTHELGHSLGAQHDSDTECSADAGYLMWPNISERTPTTLSPCSESSVRGARSRSCLLDTVDLALEARDEGDAVRFLATNTDASIGVDATLLVETGAARRGAWPAGCRAQTPSSASCTLEALGPGETRELLLTGDGAGGASGELAPLGLAELDPDDNVAGSGTLSVASASFGSSAGERGPGSSGGGPADDAAGPVLAGGNAGGSGAIGAGAVLALAGMLFGWRRGERRRGARGEAGTGARPGA